jgi:hypothetical protein
LTQLEAHVTPHPPQLLGSPSVLVSQPSESLPLQSAKPASHCWAHVPPTHVAEACAPPLHAKAHEPQCSGSVSVSTHACPQSVVPGSHTGGAPPAPVAVVVVLPPEPPAPPAPLPPPAPVVLVLVLVEPVVALAPPEPVVALAPPEPVVALALVPPAPLVTPLVPSPPPPSDTATPLAQPAKPIGAAMSAQAAIQRVPARYRAPCFISMLLLRAALARRHAILLMGSPLVTKRKRKGSSS